MRAILVEDNPTIRRIFQSMLSEYCPEVDLVGTGKNVKEGKELIDKMRPELVFLDIEMPDGFAFDLLRAIDKQDFSIIFITSHEKYALKAIKFSALDYLLKPIDPEELMEAVGRASKQTVKSISKNIETLLHNLDQTNMPSRLTLRDKYGVHITKIEDIIRLESKGNYTLFHLSDRPSILVSKGIKEYESLLPQSQFFRCHQSHLVNLNFLSKYDKKRGGELILSNGDIIPLANRKKDMLLSYLDHLS